MYIEESYKEFKSDDSNGKYIKLFDYSDLNILTASTAAYVIRQLYDKGQIDLLEYGGFLALDEDNYLLGYAMFSKGSITQTIADPQIICKNVQVSNAKKVIKFHNHPSGNLQPSSADIQNTYLISSIFSSIGVEYVDHVIVSSLGYYSFAEDKKYDFFKLTRYAASGMKIVEGTLDVYVPELKLIVENSNVTEKFMKQHIPITSQENLVKEVDKFIKNKKLESTKFLGVVMASAAAYPDAIGYDTEYDLKSLEYFKEFSKIPLLACSTGMIIIINDDMQEIRNILRTDETQFFLRLATLSSVVSLNICDVIIRGINNGNYASLQDSIVQALEDKNRQIAQTPDRLVYLQRLIKYINI